MTGRPPAAVAELVVGRHFWACEVPWLPDLLGASASVTLTGNPLSEAFGRQIAFLRAIATGAPTGSALQLRFTAGKGANRIRCHLVGAADEQGAASLLNRIVSTALPPEFPLEAVPVTEMPGVLRAVDPDRLDASSVVEIRRSVDRLDPTIEDPDHVDQVVFPWSWSPQALLASLSLLRFQPETTVLAIQIAPAELSTGTAVFLQDEIRRLGVDLRDGEDNPLALGVLRGYRRWLRLLPRGALSVRVLLATDGTLTPGIAESLSTDLTRSFDVGGDGLTGAADVIAPVTPAEVDACALILGEARASTWRVHSDPDIAALLHLFDPVEANTAFRLPVTPRGGVAGIASRRLSSVNQGIDVLDDEAFVTIGTASSGMTFALSRRDLTQHVLVAGLPGFGKSSTVQHLLSQLYLEAEVPFLVIDPSKRDYEALFSHIVALGHEVNVIRLDRRHVAANPMAVPQGVEPSVHAGRLLAAFDAALELSTAWPLAYVQLARALYRLYDELDPSEPQPTLRDLYRAVGDLLRRSRFSAEVLGNLEGSLLGRLEHIATGPTGWSLGGGPTDAVPWADLLARPTLIELGSFAAPAERSLLFGLLIAGLVSFREANPVPSGRLHVTVLEEAHRVLRPSRSSDSGVEVFVDAIAELRASGEGFIVVDQAPSLLHPGLLKLTGTKLAHRLVDQGERLAVGASMVLDGPQLEDLARLAPRRLIAYAASSSSAALVDVDEFVLDAVATVPATPHLAVRPTLEPMFCIECPVMCTGSSGLRLAGTIELVGDESLGVLLDGALKATGSITEAYCLSAWTIANVVGRRPAETYRLLSDLSSTFQQKRSRPLVKGAMA